MINIRYLKFLLIGIVISLLLINCKAKTYGKKKFLLVYYRQKEINSSYSDYVLREYSFYLPNKVHSKKNVETGEAYLTERCYIYGDSSVIFLTNNIENGANTNKLNRFNANILTVSNVQKIDTLQGQENGKYWKEVFFEKIIIGYKNVSKEDKYLFDLAIKSIQKN